MRVEKLMSLGELAELMGSETTQREAELMRQFLMDDEYFDTDDVPESEWLQMIRDAVELAEAEEGALPRLAREAASDGGPTHADLRGEVDHGG